MPKNKQNIGKERSPAPVQWTTPKQWMEKNELAVTVTGQPALRKKGRPSQSGDRQQTLLTQAFIVKKSEKDSVTIVDRLEMLQKTTDYLKLLIENNAYVHTQQIDNKIEMRTSTLFELKEENEQLKQLLQKLRNNSSTYRGRDFRV